MTDSNVLIFAPRDEPAQVLAQLENAGVSLSYGDKDWQWVKADHEDALIAAARESVGLICCTEPLDCVAVLAGSAAAGSGVEANRLEMFCEMNGEPTFCAKVENACLFDAVYSSTVMGSPLPFKTKFPSESTTYSVPRKSSVCGGENSLMAALPAAPAASPIPVVAAPVNAPASAPVEPPDTAPFAAPPRVCMVTPVSDLIVSGENIGLPSAVFIPCNSADTPCVIYGSAAVIAPLSSACCKVAPPSALDNEVERPLTTAEASIWFAAVVDAATPLPALAISARAMPDSAAGIAAANAPIN